MGQLSLNYNAVASLKGIFSYTLENISCWMYGYETGYRVEPTENKRSNFRYLNEIALTLNIYLYNRHYEKVGNNATLIPELDDLEIPSNWVWCRLSAAANIFTGNSINEQEKAKKYFGRSEGYNYIGTKDVDFDHSINYKNGVKIPYETQFRIAHNGTPLLCIEGGSAGRKIGILTEDVCFGNKLCAFEAYILNSKYLYYFLQSPQFIGIFKSNTTGIIGGVSVNTIKSLFFALPPLAEQERIVARVKELFVQIDIIEQCQKDITFLYDEFRKRTLTLAIQGKLVPQDENDEPASVLLEKIRSEKKAKLGKKYVESYIYKGDDNCYYEHIDETAQDKIVEMPFDIPDSWCWVRLEYVLDIARGGSPRPIKDYLTEETNGFNWIKIGDTDKGGKYINSTKEKIKATGLSKTRMVHKGDFLLTNSMSFGRPYIANIDGCIHDGWLVLSNKFFAYKIDFLYHLLSSSFAYNQFCDAVSGAVVKNLNSEKVAQSIFPLPPLTEQQRIVAKINEIFAML